MIFEEISTFTFFEQDGWQELVSEYHEECANKAIGHKGPNQEYYNELCSKGVLFLIGAFEKDRMVGFAVIIVTTLPHFEGSWIASMESLYLAPEYRKGTNGLRLINAAKDLAKKKGCDVLLLSAVAGSSLEKLGHRLWKHTNTVFTLDLHD